MQPEIIGWDIGGAHVKVVFSNKQKIFRVQQLVCPLWKDIDELKVCIDIVKENNDVKTCRHAVTMTGELVDHFESR
ncbi:MAG: hypothetical protein P8X88_07070, partial [Gammaproteobacteria bacterium]